MRNKMDPGQKTESKSQCTLRWKSCFLCMHRWKLAWVWDGSNPAFNEWQLNLFSEGWQKSRCLSGQIWPPQAHNEIHNQLDSHYRNRALHRRQWGVSEITTRLCLVRVSQCEITSFPDFWYTFGSLHPLIDDRSDPCPLANKSQQLKIVWTTKRNTYTNLQQFHR